MWAAPLPTFPLSLDLLGSASGSRRGAAALRDTAPVNRLRGGWGRRRGLAVGGGRHPALISIELPASSHPLTRAQPRTRR